MKKIKVTEKLSKEEVSHIAKLANLPLVEKEIIKFQKQLSQTLSYINHLKEIDTKNIKPTSAVNGLLNVLREDIIVPSMSQDEALKNAKNTYQGYFKVKAVFNEE